MLTLSVLNLQTDIGCITLVFFNDYQMPGGSLHIGNCLGMIKPAPRRPGDLPTQCWSG